MEIYHYGNDAHGNTLNLHSRISTNGLLYIVITSVTYILRTTIGVREFVV